MITISYNYHPNNVIISTVASLSTDIALIFEDNISKLRLLFAYMEQAKKEKNVVAIFMASFPFSTSKQINIRNYFPIKYHSMIFYSSFSLLSSRHFGILNQ
jgi:hypothetical protein